ncbi:TPA: hypothetical protein P6L23_002392 [Staphylococcus aureus]|nr:hypothetical protein [Staphylococcus aureus]HDP2688077.1 hypothetical protein [Staphylococcus aureus]HDP3050446.1 hypothetical protein [Staphylococcus aureus]HDP3130481.1 hypothetical protein [Staphylococcus aureus]
MITKLYTKGMVEVPPHIQQMLYEIQLKAGIPQKLMEMQGLINDETTKEEKKENE